MSMDEAAVVVNDLEIHRHNVNATSSDKLTELRSRVRDAGLIEPRYDFYFFYIALVLSATALGWTVFFYLGASWWQLAVAACLGFFAVHIGFIAHDASHRQISRNERVSAALGLFHANLLLGMSYGWWVNHHNQHHKEPNHLTQDPDITRRKAIFHTSQASEKTGFSRFVARNQGWIFFLLKPLEALGLRTSSFRAVRNREVKRPALEGLLLLLHIVVFLGLPFFVLPIQQAVAFLIVHQTVFGFYLGIAFATNHKGMPVRQDKGEWTWLEKQILTARNLRPSRILTFFYGGLNYQIEHHLFPSMSSPNLHHAVPIVKQFCAENGIPYEETGVMQSYIDIVKSLDRVSRSVNWDRVYPSTPAKEGI